MHPTLRSALDTCRGHFGAVDRADLQRTHPGAGDMVAMALVSHGWARERNDRLTLTDAGWRAARSGDAD